MQKKNKEKKIKTPINVKLNCKWFLTCVSFWIWKEKMNKNGKISEKKKNWKYCIAQHAHTHILYELKLFMKLYIQQQKQQQQNKIKKKYFSFKFLKLKNKSK